MGTEGYLTEPAAAFRVGDYERPGLEVRINFGMLTGREATRAEIDHLAHALRRLAPSFEIVSEERHEFGGDSEASLHQVVIEMSSVEDDVAIDVVAVAERWARGCYDDRHIELDL